MNSHLSDLVSISAGRVAPPGAAGDIREAIREWEKA